MKHPFFAAARPRVFAHRGGSALAPENTLAAFAHGLACGADGLELDVHLSRDGVPVVIHDASLDRTTNASGPVGELSAAELARVDAGHRFQQDGEHPFRGRGLGVPKLEEVLARHPGVPVIIELKNGGAALARAVVDAARRAGATGRVCVGSFDVAGLRVVRALEPAVATSAARTEVKGALLRACFGLPLTRQPYAGFQVPERSGCVRVISRRFVAAAARAGLGVQVWTVDAPDDARRLLGCGVGALITDRPDALVPVCAAWAPAKRSA